LTSRENGRRNDCEPSKPTNIGDFIGDLDFDFEELKRRYDIERDRRINRGSAPLYVAAKDGKFANFGKDPWAPALTRPRSMTTFRSL